jgi:hypothetical protein
MSLQLVHGKHTEAFVLTLQSFRKENMSDFQTLGVLLFQESDLIINMAMTRDDDVTYDKFSVLVSCTSDNYTQMPIKKVYICIIFNLYF